MAQSSKIDSARRKARKVVDGPVRNMERTKRKILITVGKLFSKEGYTGLNVKRIAEEAKVSTDLIYCYFESLDNLLKTYFGQKDFWDPFYNKLISDILTNGKSLGVEDIFAILHGQFDAILYIKEFERAIHWEISENTEIMRRIADEREAIGKRLF